MCCKYLRRARQEKFLVGSRKETTKYPQLGQQVIDQRVKTDPRCDWVVRRVENLERGTFRNVGGKGNQPQGPRILRGTWKEKDPARSRLRGKQRTGQGNHQRTEFCGQDIERGRKFTKDRLSRRCKMKEPELKVSLTITNGLLSYSKKGGEKKHPEKCK